MIKAGRKIHEKKQRESADDGGKARFGCSMQGACGLWGAKSGLAF